jgi:hypothetical protein
MRSADGIPVSSKRGILLVGNQGFGADFRDSRVTRQHQSLFKFAAERGEQPCHARVALCGQRESSRAADQARLGTQREGAPDITSFIISLVPP